MHLTKRGNEEGGAVQVGPRVFRREGTRVVQDPPEAGIGIFTATCGDMEGKLEVRISLVHVDTVSPGDDRFCVALTVQRPAPWLWRSPHQIFTITCEHYIFQQIRIWLLELGPAIRAALVQDSREPGVSTYELTQLLLELADGIKGLEDEVRKGKQARMGLLRYDTPHG